MPNLYLYLIILIVNKGLLAKHILPLGNKPIKIVRRRSTVEEENKQLTLRDAQHWGGFSYSNAKNINSLMKEKRGNYYLKLQDMIKSIKPEDLMNE